MKSSESSRISLITLMATQLWILQVLDVCDEQKVELQGQGHEELPSPNKSHRKLSAMSHLRVPNTSLSRQPHCFMKCPKRL